MSGQRCARDYWPRKYEEIEDTLLHIYFFVLLLVLLLLLLLLLLLFVLGVVVVVKSILRLLHSNWWQYLWMTVGQDKVTAFPARSL